MALGGELRIKAAAEVFKLGVVEKIVCVGGNIKGSNIPKGKVMRNYLIRYHRLPKEKVEFYLSEPHTQGNTNIINNYIKKQKISPGECAFLTNFYHIPRAIKDFQKQRISIAPIPAESVLIAEERKKIEKFYSSKSMLKRVISEIKGIWDKERGVYKSGRVTPRR